MSILLLVRNFVPTHEVRYIHSDWNIFWCSSQMVEHSDWQSPELLATLSIRKVKSLGPLVLVIFAIMSFELLCHLAVENAGKICYINVGYFYLMVITVLTEKAM